MTYLRYCLLLVLTHATTVHADYNIETIAEDLDFPWSLVTLPSGDLLVTELSGQLLRIDSNGDNQQIGGVPEVLFAGQGGLFDVILHPNFAINRSLFLSFSKGTADANGTTVVRAELNGSELVNVTEVFTAVPQKYAPLHYGGRLAWLPSGDLLVTTGDGFDFREKAQSTGVHFGKTIRIPVADNVTDQAKTASPFPEAPLVWSLGHRNPQGLAVASDGTMYLHEHGPKGGDEVNIIEPGNNYGWPAITYGMDYNGAYVSPFTEHPSMEQPIHTWVPSIAPSGLMIYEGDQFPDWQGDLFVGALVHQEVRHLNMENNQVVSEQTVFPEIKARIRDIRQSPDGAILVITDGAGGKIYRVSK